MKISSAIQVALLVGIAGIPRVTVGAALREDFTKQVSDILVESGKIRPGSTRADLLKIFATEGGLSHWSRRTFAHRQCPYIKVDVEFTRSNPTQGQLREEEPTDVIVKISKPYLEFSHMD